MKKFIIAILAILAAIFAILYFSKERVNLSQSGDNGEIIGQEKSNLKENLEYYGKKIIKKADEKFDEAKQTLKNEQKYHEQLKSEANRDVKIFEPIYKSGKDDKKSQKDKSEPSLQNEPKKPSKNSKKIEIDIN